jgi:hypothetical protein
MGSTARQAGSYQLSRAGSGTRFIEGRPQGRLPQALTPAIRGRERGLEVKWGPRAGYRGAGDRSCRAGSAREPGELLGDGPCLCDGLLKGQDPACLSDGSRVILTQQCRQRSEGAIASRTISGEDGCT